MYGGGGGVVVESVVIVVVLPVINEIIVMMLKLGSTDNFVGTKAPEAFIIDVKLRRRQLKS